MFFFDPMYFVFILPALLLAFYAQMKVRGAYGKWLKVPNTRSLSGADAARYLISANQIGDVRIEGVPGELSDHFYFKEFYTAESTDLVMLLVFELLSQTGKPLSELVAPLKRYFHSGEINSEVEDKDGVIRKLEQVYGHEATAITKIDGVRLDFRDEARPEEDWWFNVRPSNTEPLLRLNLEAKSREKMEKKRDELLKLIRA